MNMEQVKALWFMLSKLPRISQWSVLSFVGDGGQIAADQANDVAIWAVYNELEIVSFRVAHRNTGQTFPRLHGWSLPVQFDALHTDDLELAVSHANTLVLEYERCRTKFMRSRLDSGAILPTDVPEMLAAAVQRRSQLRWGFKGKNQQYWFMLWREYIEDTTVVFAEILFAIK